MIDEKQNGGTGPLPEGGGPAPSTDDAIREHRESGKNLQSGTMAYDKWATELDGLYRKKALELKGVAMPEREDAAAGFKPDPSEVDPKSGQPLTEEQRQASAELEQLRGDLTNAYGARAVEAIADHLIGDLGPFKDVDTLEGFIRSAGLDAEGQREAVMALGEVAKASEAPGAEISASATVSATGSQLQSVWGERFESEIEVARQTAERVFGSLENWDLYATRHGITRNPAAQVRAVMALARLGRRIGKR
jgi:hypothetical protein